MNKPIDFNEAKGRIRVPTSKRHVECPRCYLEFDLREQESDEVMMARSAEDSHREAASDLAEAIREIYALTGEDAQVAEIVARVDHLLSIYHSRS